MLKWEDFIEMKENIVVIFYLFNIGVLLFLKWVLFFLWVINFIILVIFLKFDNLKYCKIFLVYRFFFVIYCLWSYR